MHVRADKKGAALLIAVFIMTVLLAVALTFFTVTRLQVNVTTNAMNGLRASLLADAGTSLAMAMLNYDFAIHATYTSTDHAWRTYFNGAWAAGKQWTWRNGVPLTSGGVPQISFEQAIALGDDVYIPRIQDSFLDSARLNAPPNLSGSPLNPMGGAAPDNRVGDFVTTLDFEPWPLATHLHWLGAYAPVPRPNIVPIDAVGQPLFWHLSPYWPEQQVDYFADVDNNGDGLRDSMWIPIGADTFNTEDGIDNDLDGMIDESLGNGIDDDGDGMVDENRWNGRDDNGDGFIDEWAERADEQTEAVIFAYWGGADGLDNNGNGLVDEHTGEFDGQGEQRIYLTCPLRSPYGLTADGYLWPFQVARLDANGTPVYHWVNPRPYDPSASVGGIPQITVDVLDNDFDLIVGDHQEFHPLLSKPKYGPFALPAPDPSVFAPYTQQEVPGDQFDLCRTGHKIHESYLDQALFGHYGAGGLAVINGIYEVYSTGEPVCELVGRVAVYIEDEASKVNLNNAGGMTYNGYRDPTSPFTEGAVLRAMNEGLGPWEYETRLLPYVGDVIGPYIWGLLTGAPSGVSFTPVVPATPNPDPGSPNPLVWDMCMPGYGRADDNGNALWMSIDGVDNDGDGLVDEGLYVPEPPDPTLPIYVDSPALLEQRQWEYEAYLAQLGAFEGVDEPQELRQYRPLRNAFAESDGVDNNTGTADPLQTDEIGELGDRVYGTREQLSLVNGIGDVIYGRLKNLVTAHSVDRALTFTHPEVGAPPEPAALRLNYNYAEPEDIAGMLTRDWERHYQPLRWLRQSQDLRSRIELGLEGFPPNPPELITYALPGLHAAGLRQEDITISGLWNVDGNPADTGIYPGMYPASFEVKMTADNRLRADQLAVNIKDYGDRDHTRTTTTSIVRDDWLDAICGPTHHAGISGLQLSYGTSDFNFYQDFVPPEREIEYVSAGVESIRITEMMVRPVRRVEAEMLYYDDRYMATNQYKGLSQQMLRLCEQCFYGSWNPPLALMIRTDPFNAEFLRPFDPNPPLTGIPYYDSSAGPYAPERVFQWILDMPIGAGDFEYPAGGAYGVADASVPFRIMFDVQQDFSYLRSTAMPAAPLDEAHFNEFANFGNIASRLWLLPWHRAIWSVPTPMATGLPRSAWGLLGDSGVMATRARFFDADTTEGTPEAGPILDGNNHPLAPQPSRPNVVQFRFGPSTGLPPGRYYLKINVNDRYGNTTVMTDNMTSPVPDDHLETTAIAYAIKYGFAAQTHVADPPPEDPLNAVPLYPYTDILTDIETYWSDDPISPLYPVPSLGNPNALPDANPGAWDVWQTDARIGYENMERPYPGTETGMLFLPTRDAPAPPDLQFVRVMDGGLMDNAYPPYIGYKQDFAYTVMIPPYTDDPATPTDEQVYLYVAITMGPTDPVGDFDGAGTPGLAINFFEFSQEPDHEWIEITNIAEWDVNKPIEDQYIDVSGWDLAVGPLGVEGSRLFTIPGNPYDPTDSTRIAPGGSLLLTFAKRDYGVHNYNDPTFAGVGDFWKNGISMTSVTGQGGVIEAPSLEAWFKDDPRNFLSTPPLTYDELLPPQYLGLALGVFPLEPGFHYYDNDPDSAYYGQELGMTPLLPKWRDPLNGALMDVVDTNGNGVADAWEFRDAATGELARLTDDKVLSTNDPGESILPFHPSKAWDRVVELEGGLSSVVGVNGVARIVLGGGMLPNYPEHDGVDNDGDVGVLAYDHVDNDGDGATDIDDATPDTGWAGYELRDDDGDNVFLQADGLDNDDDGDYDEANEGFDEPDEAEGVDEGRWRYRAGETSYNTRPRSPGRYGDTMVPFLMNFDPASYGTVPAFVPDSSFAYFPSLCNGTDPSIDPAWTNFVERRFYPGDNVVITLYEGKARYGNVADCATYAEVDVVNRSWNDRVEIPTFLDQSGVVSLPIREYHNINFPSIWPENTMGIDFYRSLERKHPLYAGDRFGTRNRWQATDGNYDDWDQSLVLWGPTARGGVPVLDVGLRWLGSPLSMNYTHRVWDDQVAAAGKHWKLRDGEPDYKALGAGDVPYLTGIIRNRPYTSAEEAAAVPHFALQWDLGTAGAYINGHPANEYVLETVIGDRQSGQTLAYEDKLMPQYDQIISKGFPVDKVALASFASYDSVELTVATAREPLIWDAGAGAWNLTGQGLPWGSAPPPASNLLEPLPQQYTPVHLFSFDYAGGPGAGAEPDAAATALFDGERLLTSGFYPAFAGPVDVASLYARWPKRLRRVMYFTGNYDTWVPDPNDTTKPPEEILGSSPMIFFAWDESSGLVNGDYDMFVALNEPLDWLEGLMELAFDGNPDTDALADLLTPFGRALAQSPPCEDMQAYVRAYTDPMYYEYPNQINVLDTGAPTPGLEAEAGRAPRDRLLRPDPSGVAYYGKVSVRNNFLGVRIRNWSRLDRISRFSRVILTPRDRVEGRINLNTARTHRVPNSTGGEDLFNPLMGLPGVLAEYNWNLKRLVDVDPDTRKPDIVAADADMDLIDWLDPAQYPPARPNLFYEDVPAGQQALVRKWDVYERARQMMNARPVWPDGRYYTSTSELMGYLPYYRALDYFTRPLADAINMRRRSNMLDNGEATMDLSRLEVLWYEPVMAAPKDWLPGSNGLTPAWFNVDPDGPLAADYRFPLQPPFAENLLVEEVSLAMPAEPGLMQRCRRNDSMFRYGRVANLVTTRSDVFEILVTAQSGRGQDANGDGVINWRDPAEFTVRGERQTRSVISR